MKVDRPSLCTYITTPVTGTCPFACMDKNAMQKFQWELVGYASVLTNTSWDYFLIMDYGSYQPYGQLTCKMPSYRENLWGYTFTIIRKTVKSSHLYFLNEFGSHDRVQGYRHILLGILRASVFWRSLNPALSIWQHCCVQEHTLHSKTYFPSILYGKSNVSNEYSLQKNIRPKTGEMPIVWRNLLK